MIYLTSDLHFIRFNLIYLGNQNSTTHNVEEKQAILACTRTHIAHKLVVFGARIRTSTFVLARNSAVPTHIYLYVTEGHYHASRRAPH